MLDNAIRHPLTASDALTRSAAREPRQARPIKSETRLADYPRNATESERRFRFRWREGPLALGCRFLGDLGVTARARARALPFHPMTHSCAIGDVTSPARVRTRARKRVICIYVYAEAQIRRKYIPETLADESERLFPERETPLVFSKLSRFGGA